MTSPGLVALTAPVPADPGGGTWPGGLNKLISTSSWCCQCPGRLGCRCLSKQFVQSLKSPQLLGRLDAGVMTCHTDRLGVVEVATPPTPGRCVSQCFSCTRGPHLKMKVCSLKPTDTITPTDSGQALAACWAVPSQPLGLQPSVCPQNPTVRLYNLADPPCSPQRKAYLATWSKGVPVPGRQGVYPAPEPSCAAGPKRPRTSVWASTRQHSTAADSRQHSSRQRCCPNPNPKPNPSQQQKADSSGQHSRTQRAFNARIECTASQLQPGAFTHMRCIWLLPVVESSTSWSPSNSAAS